MNYKELYEKVEALVGDRPESNNQYIHQLLVDVKEFMDGFEEVFIDPGAKGYLVMMSGDDWKKWQSVQEGEFKHGDTEKVLNHDLMI